MYKKKVAYFLVLLLALNAFPSYPDTWLGEQETRALAFVHNQAGQAI